MAANLDAAAIEFPSVEITSPGRMLNDGKMLVDGHMTIDGQCLFKGQISVDGIIGTNGCLTTPGCFSTEGDLAILNVTRDNDKDRCISTTDEDCCISTTDEDSCISTTDEDCCVSTLTNKVVKLSEAKTMYVGNMSLTGPILITGPALFLGKISVEGQIINVSARSEPSLWETRIPLEGDFRLQDAVVYLYTRPLKNNPFSFATKSAAFCHWALVVHFLADDTWRTLEAFSENYKIQASYSMGRPKERGKYEEIAKIVTSPAHLRAFAISNPFNGLPYIVNRRNCQEWVLQLAKTWLDRIEKLNTFDTLSKKKIVGSVCSSSLKSYISSRRLKDKSRSDCVEESKNFGKMSTVNHPLLKPRGS